MSDGYLFVPLPDRVNRREHDAAVFDRHLLDALSGTINVRFICEQPVHIGAGFKRLHGPRIVRGGRPNQRWSRAARLVSERRSSESI